MRKFLEPRLQSVKALKNRFYEPDDLLLLNPVQLLPLVLKDPDLVFFVRWLSCWATKKDTEEHGLARADILQVLQCTDT